MVRIEGVDADGAKGAGGVDGREGRVVIDAVMVVVGLRGVSWSWSSCDGGCASVGLRRLLL